MDLVKASYQKYKTWARELDVTTLTLHDYSRILRIRKLDKMADKGAILILALQKTKNIGLEDYDTYANILTKSILNTSEDRVSLEEEVRGELDKNPNEEALPEDKVKLLVEVANNIMSAVKYS